MELHLIPWPEKLERSGGVCRETRVQEREATLENDEGYRLTIREDGVLLEGSERGRRMGRQTLAQLRAQFGDALPCLRIEDAPRFAWRGWLLDVSRHFMPVEDILKLIDAAAMFKLNVMHWHLVDDQAWRLDLPDLPELTRVGARRGRVHFGDLPEPEETFDYYTREDVRRVIAYAAERGMDVMPEIEVPGHESALLAAYPEAGCGVEPSQVQLRGGIFDSLICAGKPESRRLLSRILREVTELFPAGVIHIGGDEACKRRWRMCPDCQRVIREKGLKDENELQQALMDSVREELAAQGKRSVVWNESLRGGTLNPDFIVQAWHGDQALTEDFAAKGGKIIQSSTQAFYLDYPYATTDVGTIQRFEVCPDAWSDQAKRAVLGVECALWAERVPDLKTAAYLLFPRLPAVAETAWTAPDARRDATFAERFAGLAPELESRGLHGAPREKWYMDEETRRADRAAYEAVVNTPENLAACQHDRELMAEEKRRYGV